MLTLSRAGLGAMSTYRSDAIGTADVKPFTCDTNQLPSEKATLFDVHLRANLFAPDEMVRTRALCSIARSWSRRVHASFGKSSLYVHILLVVR